jgi:hypothetical protein
MKLNPDCIRDILLYVEENIDNTGEYIQFDDLVNYFDANYTRQQLHYHLDKISQAELIDEIEYSEDEPDTISCLSWLGHEYVSNIRDNKIWTSVKKKVSGLKSVAFTIFIECAKEEAKRHLPFS